MNDPHKTHRCVYGGSSRAEAKDVVICIHGRGGTAADMCRFVEGLELANVALVVPEANGNSWYPHSFLEPRRKNEPFLSSALEVIGGHVAEAMERGVSSDRIHFLGFSQGACLSLEYVARRKASSWGGVYALSGGLIGTDEEVEGLTGDLSGTPIFMGCSAFDPFIPESRVRMSAERLRVMNGKVEMRIYPGGEHKIRKDEAEYIKGAFG